LTENPPLTATQNAPNSPADAKSSGWGMPLATASVTFVTVLSVYLLLRPPLFNFDGYSYWLEALQPYDGGNVNPHHLLWYPIQRGIAAVTSALGSSSTDTFQISGIIIISFSLALLCLLLVRLTGRLALPFAITIFIAFSPHIWDVVLQNQPYTLLALCIVAFLWAVAEWDAPSLLRLITSGLALGAAIFLQQAMAVAVPAVAIGFVVSGSGHRKDKLKRAAGWAGSITLGVAAVYGLVARAAGIEPAGFINWTLEYLQDQHGIQVHWPQTAVKCVMGIVGTVVESSWISYRLTPEANGAAIWGLYGGILVAGCVVAVALASRRSVREQMAHRLRSNASFTSVLMLVLAWSVFVFLWEPTGHFWSVNLFPLAFLASWWVRGSGKRTALVLAGMLILISGWNIYANHRQDQAYSVNFPPPLLEQIRAQLGPNDVFIVAGRDWYANRDYSLLLECLDNWPRDPAIALLDGYVMKGSRAQWQEKLDHDIEAVFAAGGRVYVADHVFWDNSYRDLEQSANPFSPYAHMEYAGLSGETLTHEITSFFTRYRMRPTSLKIGTDPFGELKRIE
jgi:hypothetical protein